MIHTNRIVTVGEQESIIDRPIVLYRGDREVEIEFTLVGNEFTFSEEGNVIKSVNASHGQLVLNTPSGEHMFSELAECHEGKVVFVVTKEMIDEFIEMGFYSFQIRLYDSAEMKSRVTIPPVMNGFDIRNPIAAEDEANVVDQGIVGYARIFKDQSNEELPTFDWQDNYVKTEWAHHDVITENKLNKIEDALYSINANVKESDVVMLNTLDQVKKDADKYVKEHIAEVEADAAEFERNLNTDVQKFKIDTNAAMTAHKNEVSEVVDGFGTQLTQNTNRIEGFVNVKEFGISEDNEDNTEILQSLLDNVSTIMIPKGTYKFKGNLVISNPIHIEGNNCTFIFEGKGSFITINTTNCIFNRFNIHSSKGRDSETNQVCFDMSNTKKTARQIRFNLIEIKDFSDAGYLLNVEWHVTWKHCTIQKCGRYNKDESTGGIVFRGDYLINAWHGSGNIIEDTYITGCNYGIWDNGAWNVQLNNVIFEYNNYPIYKGSGRGLTLNRCWFENNTNPCQGAGTYKSVMDRSFDNSELTGTSYVEEGPNSITRYYKGEQVFKMENGKIAQINFDKSSGFQLRDDEQGVKYLELMNGTCLAAAKGGTANAGKPAYENPILSLKGYASYWNLSEITPSRHPICQLDLNYTSGGGGAGMSNGGFDFKAGAWNGSDSRTELRSVFGVDVNGNISSMTLTGTANIGKADNPYNNVYCNAIILKSPNGTSYKVTVNDDGTLKTTKA